MEAVMIPKKCHLRRNVVVAGMTLALSAVPVIVGMTAGAEPPSDTELIHPLPPIVPVPSAWTPKFPFPYDQTKNAVTDADINAMRDMCQWYNAQYATLSEQIDRIQFNRIGPDGKDFDYSRGNIEQQVDIVTGNVDQSLAFLEPRVHALTQRQNSFGDSYFPIYKGEAFFKLWEQLSNVSNGIESHQPGWFTGPSVEKAKRWGTDIHRSHVCD
jgi:hypothetical protein